jgi:hypothetical protein
MPFYKRPTDLISPGDIFSSIPFPIVVSPLKVARRSGHQPRPGQGPADFRQIFTLPADQPNNMRLATPEGEETLAVTRASKAIFLTWGSDVEDDERRFVDRGRIGKRGWLAAPVYSLLDIPENNTAQDPDTHENVPTRDLIRRGKILQAFYLPAFPEVQPAVEHYALLRDITNIGAEFFRASQAERLATLTMDSLNELLTQLVWVFTRAEVLFRPIRCECGRDVQVDVRFEGQNFDAEG